MGSVRLYGGVLGGTLWGCWVTRWSIGLYGESVGLHGGEWWVKWWGVFGYMMGSVGLLGGECWVTWWGVLCYMGDVGLHERECWVTW